MKTKIAGRLMTAFAMMVGVASAAHAETEITMWSHWGDELSKRQFIEAAASDFEAKNPGVKVKLTWTQKSQLYAATKTALRAGKGPDLYWAEPDMTEYIQAGYAAPLDAYVKLDNLEDWARKSWTYNGKLYAFPLEAYTFEMFYNKAALKNLGMELPASGQLSQAQFLNMVKAANKAGITAIASGVGDRPYPGAVVLGEAILRKLGKDDYASLLAGKLSWKDPRIMEVMNWFKEIVDAGAYPKSFATIKLGEAHYYFHTKPGAVTFPIGSWYTGRSFVPPEQGGQPKDFPLGIMQFPAMNGGKCDNCKTLAVAGSYLLNAGSPNKDLAGKFLNSMANGEAGGKWMSSVMLQTGIKTDASKVKSANAAYFRELEMRNKNADYFIGTPLHYLKRQCADTFSQVLNTALPSGLVSVEKAASDMDKACFNKG